MTMERFDGYAVNLFYDEDGEYLAHFVELPNVSAFGETPEEALKELETAWKLIKESYREEGRELPVAPPGESTADSLTFVLTNGCIEHWQPKPQEPG